MGRPKEQNPDRSVFRSGDVARYRDIENRVLVAAGRRAIRSRVPAVQLVSRRAARAALIAGTIAAATVVVREVRRRF